MNIPTYVQIKHLYSLCEHINMKGHSMYILKNIYDITYVCNHGLWIYQFDNYNVEGLTSISLHLTKNVTEIVLHTITSRHVTTKPETHTMKKIYKPNSHWGAMQIISWHNMSPRGWPRNFFLTCLVTQNTCLWMLPWHIMKTLLPRCYI